MACPLCPLVISASPAWWSSRHALACQLNMGPQSTLKVSSCPRGFSLPPFIFLLSSFFISLSSQHPATHSALFLLSNSGGLTVHNWLGCSPVFPSEPDNTPPVRWQAPALWSVQPCDLTMKKSSLALTFFHYSIKSKIKMQMRMNLRWAHFILSHMTLHMWDLCSQV